MSATETNNIEIIREFLTNDRDKNLLINQVTQEIGSFYTLVIRDMAERYNLNLVTEIEGKNINLSTDLFIRKNIYLISSENLKKTNELINENFTKIIVSDYKNYKKFSRVCKAINGYEFEKDLRYYLQKYLSISDEKLINFCVSQPYLTNSEITKYEVNSENYSADSVFHEDENFILDTRKKIFKIKRTDIDIRKLFFYLKDEAKYKKFNFLTY